MTATVRHRPTGARRRRRARSHVVATRRRAHAPQPACTCAASRRSCPTRRCSRCSSPCCSSTSSAPPWSSPAAPTSSSRSPGWWCSTSPRPPMGTAVGVSSDLKSGVIDRFRTLPMARSAILAGRTFSDLLASILCATIVLITGLVIGWRPDNGTPRRDRRPRDRRALRLRDELAHGVRRAVGERPGVGAGHRRSWCSSRSRSSPAPWCRPRGCPAGCSRSPSGTRCRRWPASLRELFGNPNPAALTRQLPVAEPRADGDPLEPGDHGGLHPDRPRPAQGPHRRLSASIEQHLTSSDGQQVGEEDPRSRRPPRR